MKKTPKPKAEASPVAAKKAAKKKAASKGLVAEKTKPAAPAKKAAGSRKIRVIFRWPEAGDVAVAGSFNSWQPQPLKAAKNGGMELALSLPKGSYEYRMVVNGHWMADPACKNSVPNPFDGYNSLLTVA